MGWTLGGGTSNPIMRAPSTLKGGPASPVGEPTMLSSVRKLTPTSIGRRLSARRRPARRRG